VCKDLGLDIFLSDNAIPTICDPNNSKSHIYLLSKEFVSSSYSLSFQYGNIIDFISYVKGISYTEAISYILKAYSGIMDSTLSSSIEWLSKDIAAYLSDMFKINHYLLKLKFQLKKALPVQEYLTQKNLLWMNDVQFVIPCNGEDILTLFDSLESKEFSKQTLKIKTPDHASNSASRPYILYPYYADYHTLSAITAEEVGEDSFHLLYESDFTHGYLGYHTINPKRYTAVLCNSLEDLADTRLNLLGHGNTTFGTVLARSNNTGEGLKNKIQPSKLPRLLIPKDRCKVLKKIMPYFKYGNEVRSCQDVLVSNFKTAKCCRQTVSDGFFTLLNKSPNDSASLKKYLSYAFKDFILRADIVEKLKYLGHENILIWADDEVFGNSKVFNSLGVEVHSTGDGYCIQKNGERVPITNFTITLQRALIFENSSDVFYVGRLHINGSSFDIVFSKKVLQQPQYLIQCATRVVTSNVNNNDIKLPTIYDRSYTKYLNNILLQESNLAKIEFGFDKLGWSADKTSFQGFGWKVTSKCVLPTATAPHPEKTIFEQYSCAKLPESAKHCLTPETSSVISIMTAMLCRTYLGWKVPTVTIKDTPKNRNFLLELFSALGQKDIVHINTNKRTQDNTIAELSGYPILCKGYDDPPSTSQCGLFYLSLDSGLSFEGKGLDKAIDYVRYIIPKLILKILKYRCSFYTKVSDTTTGLLSEGAAAIKTALGLKKFNCGDLDKFPTMYEYLLEKPKPAIRFNLKLQKVLISLTGYKCDASVLKSELESNGITCSKVGRTKIVASSKELLAVLETFYDEVPALDFFEPKDIRTASNKEAVTQPKKQAK